MDRKADIIIKDPVAIKFIDRVKEEIKSDKIILFGSRARGEVCIF